MKKLLLGTILTVTLAAVSLWPALASNIANDLPSPSGYVNDFAGVLNSQDQNSITSFAQELDAKTGAQLSVAIVDTTQPETIEGYAVNLFKKWGIGQKGKDNGVLFLIASRDHTLRIEVGYGLEGVLTDAICSQIIHQIVVPEFKQGQISDGILQGSKAIISLIAKEYGATITGQETAVYNNLHQDASSGFWVIIFVFIFIFSFYAFSFSRPGRSWYGYYGGGGFGGGGFSGGSGGFGSFGGGGSGGGGSSGSW